MRPTMMNMVRFVCGAILAMQHCAASTTTSCNADNCARAVTGSVFGTTTQSSHKNDCSSFLRCTVYPATSTVTATATVYPTTQTVTVFPQTSTATVTGTTLTTTVSTSISIETVTSITSLISQEIDTVTVTTLLQARSASLSVSTPTASTVCPTSVPTYASACSGTARFSSACSCFGVSKTLTTAITPTTTVTVTATGQTTVTVSATQVVTSNVAAVSSVTALTTTQTILTQTVTDILLTTTTQTSTKTVAPVATNNAYCSNGAQVNGLSPVCNQAGCSVTNLRIEGGDATLYEGPIFNGPRYITTASGGTHLCDGTNNGANPVPFADALTAVDAAARLCGFTYDGTYSVITDDYLITRIGGTTASPWGILLNYAFPQTGGCSTETLPTDELLWAFNANTASYYLVASPAQMTLAPGQSYTFQVQGADGSGDFVPIAGAQFAGQSSDANGNVAFVAPTTPGTYRYKATRSDSVRSNAVTVTVQG